MKNFYTSDAFEELSNLYGLDSHVLVEVVKSFAKHIAVPKEGFIEYVKPMRYPAIMPAPTPTSLPNARPVLSIKAKETNDFVEAPPYPNKVHENFLKAIANKSAKRNYTLMNRLK